MRKSSLGLLAGASIFWSVSANAATTVTASEIQLWGQAVVDYINANPSAFTDITPTDLQTIKSAFSDLSTSTQVPAYTSVYNSTLQSSTACAGIGTYPNINQTNLNTCSTDMSIALSTAGYTTPAASMGGVAALAKAMGAPLTIPGTTVAVPMSSPTTPSTTVIATTTTTTAPYLNSQKEAAAAATTAITTQIQRATTIQQAVTIINVLSSIGNPRAAMGPQRVSLGQGNKGMAAGGVAGQWSAWMNASRAKIDNTYQNLALGADTRFDGNVDNWIGGIDYGLTKEWVVGASIGYDKTKLDTFFNNGNLTSRGLMIAPYVSYQVNKIFSVDAILGFAEGDTDILSNLFATTTGKQDFTRNFAALNLSAVQWMANWQMTGKVSYIMAEEKLKNFEDSSGFITLGKTSRMEQMRVGAQVGYWANGIMPYVGLTYSNDIKSPSSVVSGIELPKTRDAYTAAIGINVFAKDLMGSLSYSTERGRSNSKNDILMGSVSYRF